MSGEWRVARNAGHVMTVKHYRELIAWQKAMDLVVLIYRLTNRFPKEELFGLTNQLRRAAVSVPSNMAEGQGRRTTRDFLNFLSIARGSLQEVETQVLIAERLGYLAEHECREALALSDEISRLISGLCSALERLNQ
jgi:four helix bundle protein